MWPTKHFTADDLDAFHSEALSNEMRLHLETCEQCRQLVVADRHLLSLLEGLGSFGPSAGLEDRVMARVTISNPATVPILSFPKLAGRRLAVAASFAAGLVASVAWSAANRPMLEAWLRGTGQTLWTGGLAWLRAFAAVLTEQPWFGTVSQVWDSPLRLALTIVLAVGSYSLGLLALRRLITPSVGEVSNASA